MASVLSNLRRYFVWIVLLALVVAGVYGFLWWRARNQRPHYVTAVVSRGNVLRSVNTTGALNPVVTVQVGSYVSGTVKSLACDFNTEVVIGQTCATIDPLPFQLIVDQDRAEVGTADAQIKKDKAALVYAKIAFDRDTKLLAEGTVSQDTVDNDQSTYEQNQAQLGLDEATLVNRKAVLKAAEVNLAYTNIVSPVVGTVITRSIDAGQTVAASLQSPTLFLIGKDLTKMQVDTNVSEADVGSLRVGQSAFFTVQAFPTRTFHGMVTQIRRGPITVQNVVTYDVVVAVPNPDRALFPGMTADAHIVIDEHDDVLRIPLPALRFTPEGLAHERGSGAGRGEGRASRDNQAASSQGSGQPDEAGAPEAANGPRPHRGERPTADEGGAQGASGPGEHRGERFRNHRDRSEQGGESTGPRGERSGGPEGGGWRAHRGTGEGRNHGTGDEHRGRVWVLENGTLRAVQVTTGLDDGALIEVSGGGLKPGDVIVVNAVNPNEERKAGPGVQNPNAAGLRQAGPRL